jgi:hypothetical protein
MGNEQQTVSERIDYLSPVLKELIPKVTYKSGWKIYVEHEMADDGAGGWHLFIISRTENSLIPEQTIRVRHGFLIPAASYNRDTWTAWVFNRCRDVETHEAGEFFRVDGVRVFAPHHGNGEDPYLVWHVSDYATATKSSGDE